MVDPALWAMTHQQRRDVAGMLDGLTLDDLSGGGMELLIARR